jgi:hypothetical protein
MATARPPSVAAGLDLRPAWRRGDARIEADAIAFWNRLGILPREVAAEARAKELAAVAYKDGRLIGVTTVTLERLEFLRARFALVRSAIDPEYRLQGVLFWLGLHVREVIEQWAAAHPQERVAGLAGIIEMPESTPRLKQPVWPEHQMTLAGFTPAGRQIRVSWFAHYRLD